MPVSSKLMGVDDSEDCYNSQINSFTEYTGLYQAE